MKHLRYLRYVLRHRWFVFLACCRLGIPWRGLVHDLSKFRPSEWRPYADHFFGGEANRNIPVDSMNNGHLFGLAEGAPREAGADTITTASFLEAYWKLSAARCLRPDRADKMHDGMVNGLPEEETLLGIPIRYSPVVPPGMVYVVSFDSSVIPGVFPQQIVVLSVGPGPKKGHWATRLLRKLLAFVRKPASEAPSGA